MENARPGQPLISNPAQFLKGGFIFLAATAKRAMPEHEHMLSKGRERTAGCRDGVLAVFTTNRDFCAAVLRIHLANAG